MQQAVVILAHGSRDAAARAEYAQVAERVGSRLPGVQLEFGLLEYPGEDLVSIGDAVARCAVAGAQRVVVLPFFLFAAGHVREDLPGELEQAALRHTGMLIAYQPPIGVDRRLIDVLESRAAEVQQTFSTPVDGPDAVLLVGAGTSDADANAELFRAARLLWERRRYPLVEVSFVSLTAPTVAEGVARCRALGARRIIAVPYFLNTGVLSRRIAARLEACRQEAPGLEIALASELGLHPTLLDLVVARARTALAHAPAAGVELPPCALSGDAWACWVAKDTPG